MKIFNPANQELLLETAPDSLESITEKLRLAKEAQRQWLPKSYEERAKILTEFNQILTDETEECAHIMMRETGKPIAFSRNELKATPSRIQYFIDHCESRMKMQTKHQDGATEEQLSFDPLGVVGNVSAWNYPYFVGSNVFVPALLTGNAVLYKPSEYATMTGLKIAEMLTKAGLPAGLFAPILGDGQVGQKLIESSLNGVFFTGSYKTGKQIAKSLAGRMIKLQLELGGKDPSYICEDMDPKQAAESVFDGACYNAGQSCCGIERVYVHEAIEEGFVEALVHAAASAQVGDPEDESTYLGPMTQRHHIEYLEAQVEDALAKGARLLHGGKRVSGRDGYFEPTVLTKVTHDMAVMKEESFGPIIPVMKVSNDQEAIELMNDTDYGLTASVFTHDRQRATDILSVLDAGTVYWNCCDRVSPYLPWTGRGHSGIGSTLSELGIDTFLKPKAWHLRSLSK